MCESHMFKVMGGSAGASAIFKVMWGVSAMFNPLKPEFTIIIFIHYKPQIAVAILVL